MALTYQEIGYHWRIANLEDDSWMPQIHERFARAIEAAATAPLLARIAELEACLLQTQNAAIDLAKQVRKEHEPGPVNLWDGTPAKYGITPTAKGTT